MTKKRKQTPQSSPLSKEPYKRREESEIIRILTEIDKGLISKLGACKKLWTKQEYIASLDYQAIHS